MSCDERSTVVASLKRNASRARARVAAWLRARAACGVRRRARTTRLAAQLLVPVAIASRCEQSGPESQQSCAWPAFQCAI